ncbi:hypothetical protein [uncultured Clostridium sp.]|uniref:hypothetical protein n=1 Tax=uncultured Clostridium sp. TaxID=59620 RepID=UPI0028F0AFD7|nr:hypothetical protein [uncultured Clostridium sp.]
MSKIILNDNTNLEFSSITNLANNLTVTFTEKTITDIEPLMVKENLTKVQEVSEDGTVIGVYNNLECTSVTKNLADSSVIINLTKLDDMQVKIENLQTQVFNLTTQLISGGAL